MQKIHLNQAAFPQHRLGVFGIVLSSNTAVNRLDKEWAGVCLKTDTLKKFPFGTSQKILSGDPPAALPRGWDSTAHGPLGKRSSKKAPVKAPVKKLLGKRSSKKAQAPNQPGMHTKNLLNRLDARCTHLQWNNHKIAVYLAFSPLYGPHRDGGNWRFAIYISVDLQILYSCCWPNIK